MPFQGQQSVVARHPAAVVADPYGIFAAAGHFSHNPVRTCVDGVFHQFLHHGARPLHGFTCGDAIGDFVG